MSRTKYKFFKFKAKLWLWPGVGGWHFVNVPDKISKEIRDKYGKGMIKILCQARKTKWNTSLFPYKNTKGGFGYLISVKKPIRKKDEIIEGDILNMSFILTK